MPAIRPNKQNVRLTKTPDIDAASSIRANSLSGVVELAASICQTRTAALVLLDTDRERIEASVGIESEWSERIIGLCKDAVEHIGVTVFTDTSQIDPPESALCAADKPKTGFAATAPIVTADGNTLGALCVMDSNERQITSQQEKSLILLANQTASMLDSADRIATMHRQLVEQQMAATARAESEQRLQALSEAYFEGIAVMQDGILVATNETFAKEFGYATCQEMIGLKSLDLAAPDSRAKMAEKILTNDEQPYEGQFQRRDGTIFPAEIRGRCATFSGKPARVTAIRNVSRRKALQKVLKEREYALGAVLESASVIVYAADNDGIVTLSEGTGLAVLGLKPGEAVGHSIFEHSQNDPVLDANSRRALAGQSVTFDAHLQNGVTLHTQLSPMFNDEHKQVGFIGVCFEVTERIASEERFRVMFEQSSHAHLIFNEDDGIIDCNAAALSMLHCEDKALLIGKPHEMLSPEYQPDGTRSVDAKNKMCERARQSGCETFEWYRKTLDGNIYPAEVTLSPITLDRKSVMLSVWVDLTERKQREQQVRDQTIALEFQKVELEKANAELEALATTDGLTGLQNHRALWERLNEEYERASRHGSSLSLILIDVDHFKLFNDKHGHLAGDVVLRAIGNILRECARETDIMARYGGEEFVVVLPETDLAGATAFADRLRVAVSTHLWSVQPVTASFGVSGLQPGDTSGADIVSRADIALYRSKLAGRNRVYCDGHLKFTNVLEDDTELFENLNEDAA